MKNKFIKNNKEQANFNKHLSNINKSLAKNDLKSAVENLMRALEIEPKNYLLLNELGNCYAKLENYNYALQYHNKAASINDKNAIILTNVAIDLLKLDRLREAIQFFEFAIEEDDKYYPAYNGLTTAYHNLGDMSKLYQISIKAITIFPERCDFHLNLGIALIYLDKLQDALFCFDTALILKPNLFSAQINQAVVYSKMGDHLVATKLYEDILLRDDLTDDSIRNSVKFNLSFQYLNQGNLVKGWEYYNFGFEKSIPFNQRRKPSRDFNCPTWKGDKVSNKTIMVWREQGLGDEILFLSMIPDLKSIFSNIIIECDVRLISIIKRSFPYVTAREQQVLDIEDYDFQIPMGSLCQYFRSDISDFNKSKNYLTPKKCENFHINQFFQSNSNKLIIGICWRSGNLNLQRNNNYIPLIEWDDIFKIPNACFVNLQYGECEEEIIEAEKKFNIKIARWSDVDLKNDLDLVFSIINSVDLVVTAVTAVSPMSFSIGKLTLVFQPALSWINLGEKKYPWSKNIRIFTPALGKSIKSTLIKISEYITNTINK
jgi:tetratricopeptide (TPR) repeat protein